MVFTCLPQCGKCCGIVPIPTETMAKHKNKIQKAPTETLRADNDFYPITDDMKCLFLNRETKECMIHEDRPKICRDYGLIPELPCPFLKANGKKRTEAATRQIQRRIDKDVDFKMEKILEWGKKHEASNRGQ